jgi:hypothetical protein
LSTETILVPDTIESLPVAGCSAAAWDCQLHTYMGAPQSVAANLAAMPKSLVERRVYMLTIQGDDRAEAHLFERFAFGDSDGTVSQWSNQHLGNMIVQMTDVLINNAGVHCPGEQIKARLAQDHDFVLSAPAPAPKTAAEAFGPVMAAFTGDKFVQATVMALC